MKYGNDVVALNPELMNAVLRVEEGVITLRTDKGWLLWGGWPGSDVTLGEVIEKSNSNIKAACLKTNKGIHNEDKD